VASGSAGPMGDLGWHKSVRTYPTLAFELIDVPCFPTWRRQNNLNSLLVRSLFVASLAGFSKAMPCMLGPRLCRHVSCGASYFFSFFISNLRHISC
jgi:hypothetical protein